MVVPLRQMLADAQSPEHRAELVEDWLKLRLLEMQSNRCSSVDDVAGLLREMLRDLKTAADRYRTWQEDLQRIRASIDEQRAQIDRLECIKAIYKLANQDIAPFLDT